MRSSFPRVVALVVTACVVVATSAAAVSTRWTPAHLVRLPASATSVPNGYLPALACPGVGTCVAAGEDAKASLYIEGVVVSETHRVWHAAQVLKPPVGAFVQPDLTPYSVACGSVGNCVVVGSFYDAASDTEPFIVREVNGVWQRAVQVALPGNAASLAQAAGLRAVACSSRLGCVAVGSYTANTTDSPVEGLVVTINGATVLAHGVVAPADANTNPFVTLSQVACARSDACVAAGTYIDADNATHAMMVDATDSPTASVLVEPANASAYPSVTVGALACGGVGSCAVVGTYETSGGQVQGYEAESSHATWPRASELVMPAQARANPHVFFYGFAGLACHAPNACTTGGQYIDATGRYQGFVDNEVAGQWRSATTLRLPASAEMAGPNGGVVAVACPGAGRCHVGAAYLNAHGQYEALVESEVANVWTAGTTLTLPAPSTSVGVDGGIYGLVCPTAAWCTATGSYVDIHGNYQGFYSSLG
ncbi:MAG TPA: hypothetical protein VND83_01655 [Acidimicrobiales bacterium]|nr:hypothetical protein [Acidimicrobiales bacterium]